MVIINKKLVYFHHVAVDMAILAGYGVERFRRCPTEGSITAKIYLSIQRGLELEMNLLCI
jgi:hypothetical protein